ncbi:hypothetical protein JL722_10408 [Aureococcus anophagefferens]|nr:hypothetical protein JL722_10408 [Aureococcus anophagefferens]
MAEIIARHVRALREPQRHVREEAARALCELSFERPDQDLIADAGGIPVLIDLLRDESVSKLVKTHAMFVLANLARARVANRLLIVEARAALIDLLRDGGADATLAARALDSCVMEDGAIKELFVEAHQALVKAQDAASFVATAAAATMRTLAFRNDACAALLAEAGAIPPLVDILRGGVTSESRAKCEAARSLGNLACRDDNRVRIAAAGGIPVLLDQGHTRGRRSDRRILSVERGGQTGRRYFLENLALNNVANAVAIGMAVGPGALVELARRGRVTVGRALVDGRCALVELSVVRDAGDHAKREAALCVAALDGVLGRVPDVVRAIIESYVWRP